MSMFDKMMRGQNTNLSESVTGTGNKMLDSILGMAGVTPEQLAQVQTLGARAGEYAVSLQNQLNRIEGKLDRLLGEEAQQVIPFFNPNKAETNDGSNGNNGN